MRSSYERAFNERDEERKRVLRAGYLSYFLNKEPSPGIAYEVSARAAGPAGYHVE